MPHGGPASTSITPPSSSTPESGSTGPLSGGGGVSESISTMTPVSSGTPPSSRVTDSLQPSEKSSVQPRTLRRRDVRMGRTSGAVGAGSMPEK